MAYFNIGNLTVPTTWISATLALILASILIKALTGKKVADWYWNGFFIYFLTWKLSYIVFNLQLFLDMPLSIVYFNGGTKGQILALTILSIYLLFIAVKKHPSIYGESIQLFLLYFICYEVIVNILEQSMNKMIIHFILLVGYLFLLYCHKKKLITLTRQILIVIIMLKLFIFSLFYSFLSIEALTFTWIGITMLILFKNK